MTPLRWLILAAIGLSGLVVGAFLAPKATLAAYVSSFGFALSLVLGALLLVLIAHLTGARWMLMYRRLAELVASLFFLLAVAFLPLALTVDQLYEWAFPLDSLSKHTRELVAHKRPYLNEPFFLVRAALYFVVWIVVAELMLRWSRRQDPTDPKSTTRMRSLAGAAIWPVVLSLTLSSIDWFMSLDATWLSSMYPVYFFSGSLLAAFALMAVISRTAERRGLLDRGISPSHYHALGKLMLTFVIFWTYIAFSQFMLIWTADLPSEVPWYIERMDGTYGVLGVLLIVGQFAVPFFLLLSRALKRRGNALAAVAALLLLMHWVDLVWLIAPSADHSGAGNGWWLHFAALFFFVGLLGLGFSWRASRESLFADGDPFFPIALRYHTP